MGELFQFTLWAKALIVVVCVTTMGLPGLYSRLVPIAGVLPSKVYQMAAAGVGVLKVTVWLEV